MRILTEKEVGKLAKPDRILNYINPLDEQPEPESMPEPRGGAKDQ